MFKWQDKYLKYFFVYIGTLNPKQYNLLPPHMSGFYTNRSLNISTSNFTNKTQNHLWGFYNSQ